MTPEAAAVRQFAGDEYGGIKAFQGSPHNFPAERLVRTPDGSTQYVVGAPDVLPNIPAGAEVLRDFPLGRQRMDKIGTGEGAQAYGHGLYFAENEGIAKSYRDALSPTLQSKIWEGVNQDGMNWQHTHQIARNIDEIVQDEGIAALDEYAPPKGFEDAWARGVAAAKANADSTGGSMYEVNINADPEAFLDWDKPFASADDLERFAARFDSVDPEMRRRIEDYGYVRQQQGGPMPDGNDLLREVFGGVGEKASVRATEMMREAGIPGIRFLDAGSRNFTPTTIKEGPSGAELYWGNDPRPVDTFPTRQAAEEAAKQFDTRTSNFVIFDENLIDIVRKYGIAGAAAMLGASQADVAQAMQQQRPQGLLSGPQ
jgi:hypothetical protein